jgi:hypothetical protein
MATKKKDPLAGIAALNPSIPSSSIQALPSLILPPYEYAKTNIKGTKRTSESMQYSLLESGTLFHGNSQYTAGVISQDCILKTINVCLSLKGGTLNDYAYARVIIANEVGGTSLHYYEVDLARVDDAQNIIIPCDIALFEGCVVSLYVHLDVTLCVKFHAMVNLTLQPFR